MPGCYKIIRFTGLHHHFARDHSLCQFPFDNIHLNTSQFILKKRIRKLTLVSSDLPNWSLIFKIYIFRCLNFVIILQKTEHYVRFSVNETCGERSLKTVVVYTSHEGSIFLVIFRMNSLRLPVFEISSIVHSYYSQPGRKKYRCKISVRNIFFGLIYQILKQNKEYHIFCLNFAISGQKCR